MTQPQPPFSPFRLSAFFLPRHIRPIHTLTGRSPFSASPRLFLLPPKNLRISQSRPQNADRHEQLPTHPLSHYYINTTAMGPSLALTASRRPFFSPDLALKLIARTRPNLLPRMEPAVALVFCLAGVVVISTFDWPEVDGSYVIYHHLP